jgi:hypothetical protein
MHDCPGCQTPLHGHESFCPICGTKQLVRTDFQPSLAEQYKKSSNPIGLILLALLIIGLAIYGVKNSWIGELIKRGPLPAEETLTPQAARAKIEALVMQKLTEQSAAGKFVYTAGEDKPVDINYPQSVSLAINVNLKHPELRRSIVEPVKDLMAPANINTITLNDEHSHATVTLTLPPESGTNNPDSGASGDQTSDAQSAASSNSQ